MSVSTALKAVQEHAVKIQNNAPVAYTDNAFPVNAIHWQGDVGIWRVAPGECKTLDTPVQNPQLAPGTTKGSRHVVADMSTVTLYTLADGTVLDGPVMECHEATEITHPEHGNVTVPKGTYRIRYQRQFADELRRVQD